ncbi:hypothetical protein F4819DRAFT_221155 [Hypoxylon fuscum]|nr:hypothetical protein F4819DRAFT_221155 [Hypoxylon fuscum]
MDVVLRDACDNCHRRKTRCPLKGYGACENCRKGGQACVFSPRSLMGRPKQERQRKRASARGPCNTSQASNDPKGESKQENAKPIPECESQVMIPTKDGAAEHSSHQDDYLRQPQPSERIPDPVDDQAFFSTSQENGLALSSSAWDKFDQTSIHDVTCRESPLLHNDLHHIYEGQLPGTNDLAFPHWNHIPVPNELCKPGQLSHRVQQNNAQLTCENAEATHKSGFPSSSESGDLREWTQDSLQPYKQLSQLLFSLHTARDVFLRGNQGRGPRERMSFENIFMLVSSLCDVVARLRDNCKDGPSGSTSPCILLAFSIIGSVVDIYQEAMGILRDALQNSDLLSWMGPAQTSFLSYGQGMGFQQQCYTHLRLQIMSDAIAMDFHLTQLKSFFEHSDMDADSSQTPLRLEEVCATLRTLIDKLRTT